jgi:hypothetical protein
MAGEVEPVRAADIAVRELADVEREPDAQRRERDDRGERLFGSGEGKVGDLRRVIALGEREDREQPVTVSKSPFWMRPARTLLPELRPTYVLRSTPAVRRCARISARRASGRQMRRMSSMASSVKPPSAPRWSDGAW